MLERFLKIQEEFHHMDRAAQAAHMAEYANGGGSAHLSSGKKQRISIARAMLKDAPIIILDEATANVDPENEDRLQKAIEALTRNKTILMIAHRLKTVHSADQILVLDGGTIVQQGKHENLIAHPGIYADFVGGKRETASWKL